MSIIASIVYTEIFLFVLALSKVIERMIVDQFFYFLEDVIVEVHFSVSYIVSMNIRQYQLQTINRNLQSKILTLRQEHRIMNERYEERVKNINDQHKIIISDKDKTIEYLKKQLDQDRELILYEQKTFDSCRHKEKLDLMTELEKYKSKCSELERRVQSVTQKYELKNKELQEENIRLRQVVHELHSTSRLSLQSQIDKLSKFYHTSRVQQSRRQNTVEWIQTLTNFIEEFDLENKKVTQESLSNLQAAVEQLKHQIINPMKALSEHEETSSKERKLILEKIVQICEDQNKITQQSTQQNEKLWELMKKERQTQQTQKISILQKQLTRVTSKYQQEVNSLLNRIKQLQNERKTLLLGFTQLKSLNQSRQKTYRQQIHGLKHSIDDLLAGIQQREGEFQTQLQALHGQLSNLNDRYYENIEVPLHSISGQIEAQLKAARVQIQNLAENKGFIKMVQNLDSTLQKYIHEQGVSSKLSAELTQYARRTQSLAIIGNQLLQAEGEKKFINHSPSKMNNWQRQEKALVVQQGVKQNKLNYEIGTLKRQNKKLRDEMQPKGPPGPKFKQSTGRKHGESKTYQLEMEVQRLKELNQGYQEEFMYQLKSLKQDIRKISGFESKQTNQKERFIGGLRSTQECNKKILDFLQRENNHIKAVRDILSALDRILVRPVQVFDDFIGMIGKCFMPSQFKKTLNNNSNAQSIIPFQKLKAIYSQITVKRQQNVSTTNRLTAQLIRVLRESMPVSVRTKPQENQEENKLERSRLTKEIHFEKKLREFQSQKIKNREEFLRKIEKIQEVLKSMDQKAGKRPWSHLNRLQDILDKKLLQLTDKYMGKTVDSAAELSNITASALKDLKAKLKSCMQENEGLIKEIEYINTLKKQSD